MHTLEDTPCNPAGLCALSVGNDTGYIAYPGSTTDGSLEIFDSMTMVGYFVQRFRNIAMFY